MNNALQSGILASSGPIAATERTILLNATLIMLAVIVGTLVFARWFRARNGNAKYLPDWTYSGRIELVVWSIPTLIVLFLGWTGLALAFILILASFWAAQTDMVYGRPSRSCLQRSP